MAQFKVKLGSGEGEITERVVHGTSLQSVKSHYTNEGYFVFSVKPQYDLGGFGLRRKIPARRFILFNREFRGLLKAGLPVLESIDILLRRMKKSNLRDLLEQIREKITKGVSLSEAFASFSDLIPRYYPALLSAGEQSGNLVEVLERFIVQEERLRRTRKKFMQSLTYPAILLLAAMGALYIMLTRAMPEFASMYENSNEALPWSTQMVVTFSEWINAYFTTFSVAGLVVVIAAVVASQTEKGIITLENLLRRLPLIGTLWTLQNQNIFARTLRLLLNGGVPLTQAIGILSNAIPSRALAIQLKSVQADVESGNKFQEALEEHTFLGDSVGEMVRVGEETGTLEEMLDYLADNGEEQAEDMLEMISNLIAPVVLLFVGLLIAFLVLAMYLPMFNSYELMGR
ncbi:type II secretion system F family protein [Acanthopleuribacter pedis]|uniref:Type II secretion system F family protein n=1 Tax=Acanthopleuribacter pedis TaxID=442870 RepID=A0A8J7QEB9_9BACT|nr:type II secretion system F family protein [Acanthopleuribacter pedis]MBO1318110.1 type II secretion system F family protein [Acanthopleuribacter pedis]